MDMLDKYRIQIDVYKKACYTCNIEETCKCRTLEENIPCKYSIKPEVRRILKTIKPLFGR